MGRLFDGNDQWKSPKLPALHIRQYIEVLKAFAAQERTIGSLDEQVYSTVMWDETNAQKSGMIKRDIHMPKDAIDAILSGPHIAV